MRKRRQSGDEAINAGGGSRFSTIADALWTIQDNARTATARALEWLSWALRRWLVWPLQDRAGTLERTAPALGLAALVLLAAGAGVAALLWAAPDGGGGTTVAEVAAPVTKSATAPAVKPVKKAAAPTLHGAAPNFKPVGRTAAEVSSAEAIAAAGKRSGAATTSIAPEKISSTPSSASASASAATAGKSKAPRGPVAGPKAVAVAREFADAFVSYEIGGAEEPSVRRAFAATTTPELARALLRRPPRQPATVKVPEAKVLNIVPAPSHGHVFPVSVSLLRVGATSELRLELEKPKGKRWQVINVLG